MADNSRENSDHTGDSWDTWLELAVPLLSFGGAGLAIILWVSNAPFDFRISIFGCVIASWVLAYLAWIRPKKDIVALSTPIYSFIFIAVPTDIFSTIILQVLYAISLTILLLRLKYRFGETGTAATLGKELGGTLKTYIEDTRASLRDINPDAAHAAAVVFVRFAEGNYGEAEQSSKNALIAGENPGQTTTLMRAFSIIREHSMIMNKSLPRPATYQVFQEKDIDCLAKPPVPSQDADTEFYTALDNALLVLYSAAWNGSERDRPHLLACQVFAQKLMSSK